MSKHKKNHSTQPAEETAESTPVTSTPEPTAVNPAPEVAPVKTRKPFTLPEIKAASEPAPEFVTKRTRTGVTDAIRQFEVGQWLEDDADNIKKYSAIASYLKRNNGLKFEVGTTAKGTVVLKRVA